MHANGLQHCLTAWLRASSQRNSPSGSTRSSRHAARQGCKLSTDACACHRKLIHPGTVYIICWVLALDWRRLHAPCGFIITPSAQRLHLDACHSLKLRAEPRRACWTAWRGTARRRPRACSAWRTRCRRAWRTRSCGAWAAAPAWWGPGLLQQWADSRELLKSTEHTCKTAWTALLHSCLASRAATFAASCAASAPCSMGCPSKLSLARRA